MRIWGRALLVEGTSKCKGHGAGKSSLVPSKEKGARWSKGCAGGERGQEGACNLHENFAFGRELRDKVGVGLETWELPGQNEGG